MPHDVTSEPFLTLDPNKIPIKVQDFNFLNFIEVEISVTRLNSLTAEICRDSSLSNCTTCGQFLRADNRWNYLRCDREIQGSWVHLETQTAPYMNLMEIIIHYTKDEV